MLERMLLHTCEVHRKQRIEGKGLSSNWVKIAENVKCLVIPATEQSSIQDTVIIGKDYMAYFNKDADVKEGDKIVVSTGKTLMINGLADYKDFPRISHKEYTCQTLED